MQCLQISTNSLDLECHSQVVKMAERIRKVMFDKHGRRHSVLDTTHFPSILERDVE